MSLRMAAREGTGGINEQRIDTLVGYGPYIPGMHTVYAVYGKFPRMLSRVLHKSIDWFGEDPLLASLRSLSLLLGTVVPLFYSGR
jgi:hypothetical protein